MLGGWRSNRLQPEAARNAWRSAREVFAEIGMRRYERICDELLAESEGQKAASSASRPEAGASAAWDCTNLSV